MSFAAAKYRRGHPALRRVTSARSGPSLCLLPTALLRPARGAPWRRTYYHTSRLASPSTAASFSPPPSPARLSTQAGRPTRAPPKTSSSRGFRRLLATVLILSAAGLVDREVFASGAARSLRTFSTCLVVAIDYKVNFRAEPLPLIGGRGRGGEGGGRSFGDHVAELHQRNADRLFRLLMTNGGLYLKIGQAVAMQSAVLPPEFQRSFARMFDDAPQQPWSKVERVVRDDFGGRSAEDVFGVTFNAEELDAGGGPPRGIMERTARASASVAQVHWARLPDGREVAVKIQKPEIAKQIGWDLWSFKAVSWLYSWWFELPLYSQVPFITERLALETDFENEARNSERMRELVAEEPSLRGRVYIPAVLPELSSKRVLTAEWIEGVRLRDKDGLTRPWAGGRWQGFPGVDGAPLAPPDMAVVKEKLREDRDGSAMLKPERAEWRGPSGGGGLGVTTKDVMSTMIDLFSAQIFKFGVVHADPHPGNVLVRRRGGGGAEMVLLDHGLYVYLSDRFRREYSEFWKALLTFDNAAVSRITAGWGVRAAELFASATLLRPYDGGDGEFRRRVIGMLDEEGGGGGGGGRMTAAERSLEMQRRMKQGVRDVLADETKWPKELAFIGRNMRIVQGNNQHMGSPVNRVKRMGEWASRSLVDDRALPWRERLRNAYRHVLFKAVLAASDVAFYFFALRQWIGAGGGLEDALEAHMRVVARDFGVELQHGVFDG